MNRYGSVYHFPQLHKGACYYDILSRFHEESGHFTSMATSKELFGSCPDLRPTVVLPYRAEMIYTWLGPSTNITTEILRDEYSAWQYLQLDKRFSNNTLDPILRADAKPGRRKQAEMRFAVQNCISRLRYCPLCIVSDFFEEGEPFWHQVHQIFGVKYCPIHGIPLIKSEVSLEKKLSHYIPASTLFSSSSIKNMLSISEESVDKEDTFKDNYINLSQSINWLLNHGLEFSNNGYLKKCIEVIQLKFDIEPNESMSIDDFFLTTIGMPFLEDLFPNGTVDGFLMSLKKMEIDNLSPFCQALILASIGEQEWMSKK